jgi:hypothetical protein
MSDSTRSGPKPGQRINVDIQIKSVVVRGDTVAITYQVKNLADSKESLLSFLVDVPSGVKSIATPGPRKNWYASTDFRQRPMAVWDLLAQQLPPGGVTPDLSFEAIGLPAISTFWAGGKFKRSSDEDAAEAEIDDPLSNEMIHGVTVGVEPMATDKTPRGLLQRLEDLTNSSCKAPTLWITDNALCRQLVDDIGRAKSLSSHGQVAEASEAMSHYQKLLDASVAPSTAVTSSGYWLLKSNAEIVKRSLSA